MLFLGWTQVETGSVGSAVAFLGAAGALLAGWPVAARGREGWAFLGTFVAIALGVAGLFLALFPDVMPTTLATGTSLTTTNAAATAYTLKIMTVVAVIFTPLVLAYQGWTYWVFRKRIAVHHIPAAVGAATVRPADPRRAARLVARAPGLAGVAATGLVSAAAGDRAGLGGGRARGRGRSTETHVPQLGAGSRRRAAWRAASSERRATWLAARAAAAVGTVLRSDLVAAAVRRPRAGSTGEVAVLVTRGVRPASPTSPATCRRSCWPRCCRR